MKFVHGVTATLAAQFVGLTGLVVAAFVADEISERQRKAKAEGEIAGYKRGLADAEARAQQAQAESRARQAEIERSLMGTGIHVGSYPSVQPDEDERRPGSVISASPRRGDTGYAHGVPFPPLAEPAAPPDFPGPAR